MFLRYDGSKTFHGFAYMNFVMERKSLQTIHSEEFILIILELSITKKYKKSLNFPTENHKDFLYLHQT